MGRIGFAVCLMTMMIFRARATTYYVGDMGWTLGFDSEEWTKDKTFIVGDSLYFDYRGETNSVDEVNKEAYDLCLMDKPISSNSKPPTTIVLKTSGVHYFKTFDIYNCGRGLKLAVTVCNVGVDVGSVASLCVGV